MTRKPILKIKSLIGKKINQLTILDYSHSVKRIQTIDFIKCRCDCGREKTMRFWNVYTGQSKTCGHPSHIMTHGLSKTREYKELIYIKSRHDICKEWKENPKSFVEWYLKNNQKGKSLWPADPSKPVGPGNFKYKQSKIKIVNYKGEEVPMIELAKTHGINRTTLIERLKRGLSLEEALTKKVMKIKGKNC